MSMAPFRQPSRGCERCVGDYGEVVVPLRILSYVIEGELDQKVASIDPGFALTYAEQVRRAETAEEKLAEAREEPSGTGRSS